MAFYLPFLLRELILVSKFYSAGVFFIYARDSFFVTIIYKELDK